MFLLHRLTHVWLQRAFPKCTRMNHVPKELCIHMSSKSGFLGRSRSKIAPIFAFQKSFAFTMGKIRLSNREKIRIMFRIGFQKAISERDLFLCEQAHTLTCLASAHCDRNFYITTYCIMPLFSHTVISTISDHIKVTVIREGLIFMIFLMFSLL